MSLEYVNPYVGSIGHLLRATKPVLCRPHSMVGMCPIFDPGVRDLYWAARIHGFPIPVNLHQERGCPRLMPFTGSLPVNGRDVASEFDHDFERATPYRYFVLLERYNVEVDCLATEHGLLYRFAFPKGEAPQLLLRFVKTEACLAGKEVLLGKTTFPKGREGSFFMRFDEPVIEKDGVDDGLRLRFQKGDGILHVRLAISFLGTEQAQRHLSREIGKRPFEELEEESRTVWQEMLDRIRVEGGTLSQRRTFYTALWRSMHQMQNISEEGSYWSGYDGKVHRGEDPFYVKDQIWDTFRSAHPLRVLIDPKRELDMVRSYLRMYEQSGWLARFPEVYGDRPCMLGHHAVPMIVDAYRKGLIDFDVESAYEGMKKSVTQATKVPWRNGPFTELDWQYLELGYFPAINPQEAEWISEVHPFEKRQAVSVSLECCYDEHCLTRMAEALDKEEDEAHFRERATHYRKLYHPELGLMAPRLADGRWVEPFDPKLSGGQGGRDYYAECNGWTYTWSVQHDIAGLAKLMGGREACQERLDQLFLEQPGTSKFKFLGQFPDSTGLIGQFVTGNEPSFHIPYLYNYLGAPWKTQRRIREIMRIWFGDGPLGLCGDEDGGAMSAWHVFNAMGFFPVCPGEPYYCLGSPVFESVEMALGEGKRFKITAEGSSPQHKYINSVFLKGEKHDKPWFDHQSIQDGAEMILEMSSKPNKEWGSHPEDAPPSLSDSV